MTDAIKNDLRRTRVHLNLLEQNATQPLDFLSLISPTAPPLILRPGDRLRTAHSDVALSYEDLRGLMMQKLRLRVAELNQKLIDSDPSLNLDERQYGDQTEA